MAGRAAGRTTASRCPTPPTWPGSALRCDTNTMLHAAPFPATTRFPGVKEPVRADEHGYLVRRHLFVGPAWYERDIEIPAAWQGRPSPCASSARCGRPRYGWMAAASAACDSLVAEHRHELGPLAPGRASPHHPRGQPDDSQPLDRHPRLRTGDAVALERPDRRTHAGGGQPVVDPSRWRCFPPPTAAPCAWWCVWPTPPTDRRGARGSCAC